jgi:hypothetical protein
MTPQGSDFGISASIYYSYLLPTTSKGADGTTPPNKVSIPPELGGNLYGLFPIQEWPILYGGLDIEKFSSFNLDGIVNENIVYIDRNTILYITAGIIKKISEGNSSYTFKFSLSKSIMGTFENGNPDPLSQKTILSGYKIMAFTSIKMSPDWSTDMMVKYHSFSGDITLSTMRIGVGLTYSGF